MSKTNLLAQGEVLPAAKWTDLLPVVLGMLYLGWLWDLCDLTANATAVNRSGSLMPLGAYLVGGLAVTMSYNGLVKRRLHARYCKTEENGRHHFLVTPAHLPEPMMLLGLGGLVFSLLAPDLSRHFLEFIGIPHAHQYNSTVFVFLPGAALSYGVYRLARWLLWFRGQRHRKVAVIEIVSGTISASGRTFATDSITALVLCNHLRVGQTYREESYFVMGSGMGPLLASGSMAVWDSLRRFYAAWCRTLANVSFHIDLESGGRAYTLAGGLDETTARGLLSDMASTANVMIAR